MRFSFALLLALIVALSGVTMAGARHQPRPFDQVTLCTGSGVVVLSRDAQGDPVGPMLPCPECLPPLLATAPCAALQAVAIVLGSSPGQVKQPRPSPSYEAPGFHWSRGPPVRV